MIFVDTNYFLRFLLEDLEDQFSEAKDLIQQGASGKAQLFTSIIVLFEIYWVLSSYYGQDKDQLIATLNQILDLEFIRLEERPILRASLNLFSNNSISFEDCYNLVYAKNRKAKEFKTFDKKLSKLF